MSKDFIGVNHGKGRIMIKGEAMSFKPVEIHLKENGTIGDKPSFAFLLTRPDINTRLVAQISLKMLNEGLADIGYEIIKKG